MTTQTIVESGMKFGPYPDGHCFHVEKSGAYAAIQQGVPMAEFLLLRTANGKPPTIFVVEAKSSSPRPETQPNFDDFIAEVREKLVNAFSLGWACCLDRHREADRELPNLFKTLDLSRSQVRFVLVIKDHRDAWLPPIQDAMAKALRSTVRTWAFDPSSVVAINDVMAERHGLILPER